MLDIKEYWPTWRGDINERKAVCRPLIEMSAINDAATARAKAILANQHLIMTGLYWLLDQAEEQALLRKDTK